MKFNIVTGFWTSHYNADFVAFVDFYVKLIICVDMPTICNFDIRTSCLYCAWSIIKTTVINVFYQFICIGAEFVSICTTIIIFSHLFTHFFVEFDDDIIARKRWILNVPEQHHFKKWSFNSSKKISRFSIHFCAIWNLSSSKSGMIIIGNIVPVTWLCKTCPYLLVKVRARG